MSSSASQPKKQKSQADKFIDAARELGCDEDESAFDAMVKKVAKAPPPRQEPQNANASRSKPKK